MATVTAHNGVWGEWSVVRIKGEKGDAGEAGSSVYIEGKFATLAELKNAWSAYVGGDSSKFTGTLDPGDGYFVEEDGFLYVYSGGWDSSETDSNFDLYWTGVALKGEPGDSAYLYIKYSDDGGVHFTADNGTVPGKYIAILPSMSALDITTVNNSNTYKGLWHL